MNSQNLTIFLGVVDIAEAKRIKLELSKQNIHVDYQTNDQTCTRGCKVTVELWGDEKDVDSLRSFYSKEFNRDLQGHEINHQALSSVFDPTQSTVVCQACGHSFSPNLTECPECGLCYG